MVFIVDINSLDKWSRQMITAIGYIVKAKWATARAYASLPKNGASVYGIADTYDYLCAFEKCQRDDVIKYVSAKLGAMPGDIVTFKSVSNNKTIVSLEIKA